jgi:ABC-type transport system involved in multi-copper enzyme maturation permease subunit
MTYYAPQRLTDQRGSIIHVLIAWAFALLTLLYFLPWAIAASRYKSNSLAIMLINLLLGWTFIGWVVALVMACGSHQMAAVLPSGHYPPPGYLPPGQLPLGYMQQGHLAANVTRALAAPPAGVPAEQGSGPHEVIEQRLRD